MQRGEPRRLEQLIEPISLQVEEQPVDCMLFDNVTGKRPSLSLHCPL